MDIVRSLHARRAAEVITVPRLPEPAVLQMATACLGGGEVSDQAVRQLLANCDGLPFAVEETARVGRRIRRARRRPRRLAG